MKPPIRMRVLLERLGNYRWVENDAYWDWYIQGRGHWHLTEALIERIMETAPEEIPRHLADTSDYAFTRALIQEKDLWAGISEPSSGLEDKLHQNVVAPILQSILEQGTPDHVPVDPRVMLPLLGYKVWRGRWEYMDGNTHFRLSNELVEYLTGTNPEEIPRILCDESLSFASDVIRNPKLWEGVHDPSDSSDMVQLFHKKICAPILKYVLQHGDL